MEEKCPLCFRKFPLAFLERHVNTCLDSHSPPKEESPERPERPEPRNAFAALGLKADSRKPADKPNKKEKATLTSILIKERQLKRKQEQLEREIQSQVSMTQPPAEKTSPALTQIPATQPQPARAEKYGSEEPKSDPVEKIPTSSQEVKPETEVPASPEPTVLQLRQEADLPLAQRLRPRTLDDFFGQEKLVGEDGILRGMLSLASLPSFILWGVPGVGKTSLARIVAHMSQHKFVEVSGSDGSAKRLKEVFAAAQTDRENGVKTILFLDEIHRFNKAVQDILLPVIEKGTLTVVGATTENPSFSLNNALLSRMHTFVMDPLSPEALVKILNRGLFLLNKTRKLVHGLHLVAMSKDAIDHIAHLATGDSRVALNILESINAYLSGDKYRSPKTGVVKVDLAQLKQLLALRNFHQQYDRVGDNHYDTISAFHKSVRGSDADAAIFYLARMLKGGEDPLFIMRRMVVIASEDIGLRDSLCLPFIISALEAVQFVGMPEGRIIMAHCAVKLAKAPKSTKSYRALNNALALLSENPDAMKVPIPLHLRNAPTRLMKDLGYGDTYRYNPNYKQGLVKQEYLPEPIKDSQFVEETHLGIATDRLVDPSEYEKAQAEYDRYKQLKRERKEQFTSEKRRKLLLRVLATKKNLRDVDILAERTQSYDENLDPEQQIEYFPEVETEQDDGEDELNNFDCSYDELMAHADDKDFPIFFSEQL